MSMMAQKLNGNGTIANDQLLELQKISALAGASDLFKTAKEFCLGKTLTPVATSWMVNFQQTPVVDLNFDGLYFGKFQMQHSQQAVAGNDNGFKRSVCRLLNVQQVVAQTQINIHGDDILAWETSNADHYGFATGVQLSTVPNDQIPQHSVVVSFIGFKLTQQDGFIVPPPTVAINANNSGNVNLTVQDLTSLGYTYQWSETTGQGTFINPNSPNAIFVPDGNGSYVIKLIVKDGDIESDPIQIPVEITQIPLLLKSLGGVLFTLANGVTVEPNEEKTIYVSSNQNPSIPLNLYHWRGHIGRLYRQDGNITSNYNSGVGENLIGNGFLTVPADNFEFEFLYRLEEGRYLKNNLGVDCTFITPQFLNRSGHTQIIAPDENLSFGDKRQIKVISSIPFTINNHDANGEVFYNSVADGANYSVEYFDQTENGRNHTIEAI